MQKNRYVYIFIVSAIAFAVFQLLTMVSLSWFSVPGNQTLLYLRNISFLKPKQIDSAGLSSASATLTNPRLSFQGLTNSAYTAGTSVLVVKASGNSGDLDTRNLFPNDLISVGPNSSLQIGTVEADLVTFTVKSGLTVGVAGDSTIYGTQSGILRVRFFTASAIPANGSIKIAIPAAVGSPNDGAPDTASSVANNGFDWNGMTNTNVTCPAGFTAGAVTIGTGGSSSPHYATCNNSAVSVPAGADLTVEVGTGSKTLINPAPIYTGHTRGIADVYSLAVTTNSAADGAGTAIESVMLRTAPVEGVLVTANVDETLSFTVQGVSVTTGTICGITRTANSIVTTATSVPWGTINSAYLESRNNAAQQLIVTTNSSSGYNVYAEENDQMGRDGSTCTGATPSVGEYTFGSASCIRDYANGASHTTATDWTATPGTNYGFGYSLENASGTDARFLYNGGGVWMAKQFADQELTPTAENKYETNADLMYNTAGVSGSSVYVCFRIHIPGTQPAGYYFNTLRYTAVAKF
ncbi:MAG: hypothetical protein WC489_04220 [Patescibacteria group bacterium]